MPRSRLIAALLAALLLTALVSAGTYVLAQRRVRLACDDWPPYSVQVGGRWSGLTVDVVMAVCARLGLDDVEIVPLPWMRAMDMVRFGEADALFNANYTTERTAFFRFPEESLVETPWNIWTRKGTAIRTMDDLKGKKIGVVLGYAYTPDFWEFIQTYCTVEEVYSDKINFRKLSLGRLDATVADLGNALALADEIGVAVEPGVEIKRDGLYLAFSRIRIGEDFVQRFSDALREFKTTEAYAALLARYLIPSQ